MLHVVFIQIGPQEFEAATEGLRENQYQRQHQQQYRHHDTEADQQPLMQFAGLFDCFSHDYPLTLS